MNPKIKIITPPDIIFSDNYNILLVHPSAEILSSLQNEYLSKISQDISIYNYDITDYDPKNIDWLLSVFHFVDLCIFNLDSADPTVRNLASYFIAKSKTYWLTNSEQPVYNHISNQRVYNLEFLNGGYFGET